MACFGTQHEAPLVKSTKCPFQYGKYMTIFLSIAFYRIVLFQGGRAKTLWPRDSYDLQFFLRYEGEDCLRRIFNHGTFPIYTYDTSFTPEQESKVLLDIYAFTNGKQWYNNSGWNSSTEHCSWYGITCHGNSYIKSIVLPFNNLDGHLPSNLWKIRNLFSLCTPGNPNLQGRLGDFLFGNMSSLLAFVICASSVSGQIPEDIANLTNLQTFIALPMHRGGLTGQLPRELGSMRELRMLQLGGNNLTGQIPRSISKLKKLYDLNLRNTHGMISGNLSDIFAISSLRSVYISGVNLIGEIPRKFPPYLAGLLLPGNNISGKLPETFPNNSALQEVNLANNHLTGDIPGHLLLKSLDILDLSQNRFTSINEGKPWPKDDKGSINLYLSLAENRDLAIDFQSFLGLFEDTETLSFINVSYCGIESPILPNLFYLQRLSTIDLSGNKLYGEIPDIFEDRSVLSYLDISLNNLSGSLPGGAQSFIALQYLDISGNPYMKKGTSISADVFQPDFSRMIKQHQEDNFTCPEGRFTFNNGRIRLDPTFYEYKYCICDARFYGDTGLCKLCLDGGTCNKAVVSTLEDIRPNIMRIAPGYWPSPSTKNVTHFVRCPVPASCNPMASCTCHLDKIDNDPLSTHAKRLLPTLITTCNQSCICHPGNTDRFCSRCKKGFYKIGGLCYQCVKGDLTYYYVFIPIFAFSFIVLLWSFFYFSVRPIKWFVVTALHFLLMLIFMLLEFLPTWVFKLNLVVFVLCMSSRGKGTKSLISIAVFYIQTLDFMVSSSNVWPPKIVAAQSFLSSYWNLYFPSLSCDLPSLFNPVGKFAFILLLPIGCLAMVGVYFIIMQGYDKVRPQERRMENVHFKCRQSAFFCLSFTYFPVVKQTLSILRPCQDDRNILYMPASPWIECTSDTYRILSALGFVSLAVYVIGFPLLLASLLFFFFRKRIDMSPEDRKKLDTWLGPAYLPYKPRYQQYFELVMLLRRLLLAIALSTISSSTSLQSFVVWIILVGFAIIHLCLHPYDDVPHFRFASENLFEPLVLLALSMSFMLLRFSALESSISDTTAYVWIVVIVNSCFLLSLIITIFYRLVLTRQTSGELRMCPFVDGRNGRGHRCQERDNLLSVN